MRSFFKKPAWAANAEVTGTEFYRRSGQTYGDIVAANRAAHAKAKIELETLENIEDTVDGMGTRRLKRPRHSNEAEATATNAANTCQPTSEHETDEPRKPPTSPGHHQNRQGAKFEAKDDMLNTKATHPRHGRPDDSLSTPLPAKAVSLEPPSHLLSQNMDGACIDTAHRDISRPSISVATHRPTQPSASSKENPIVQILITSQIPNTKPLLVHRKMSQSLGDVRIEWCKRQEINIEMQSSVHLTWRGRRLFDVTTCRSLGIKLESKQALSELDDDPIAGTKELRIHMEAVTDDPLLLNRPGLAQNEDESPAGLSTLEDDHNEPMKLTLRSAGLSDLRIRARPKTLVSKLVSVFCDRQNITADRDVSLLFDGDRMDPDTRLRDHDIADLDMVDVLIKPQI